MRAAIVRYTRLRETEVQDFSISDQIFDRTSCIFDWYVGIDAVLVEEVYAIGSKALERGLSHLLDILRSAIQRY